ncbi:luciferase-like domain-containing protein [Aspergillus filifer]
MAAIPTSIRSGGPTLRGPLSFETSPLRTATRQPLMLGVFLDMQDRHISSYPTSNSWTFPCNLEIVQRAESADFDIAFSRMQWLPEGGYDREASLDAFYGATLNHISQGRWGINVVTGHREIEHQMFGWNRIEHDRRYGMAGELLDVVTSLWGETENISYKGRVSPWKLEDAWVTPKPVFGRPILVNATGSPAGIDFAVRYSDSVFITSPGGADIASALESLPGHDKGIKEKARALGREIKVLINPVVVSKDTSEETWGYLQNIVNWIDEGYGGMKAVRSYDSDAHAWRGHKALGKRGYKLGGNIKVFETPKEVVEQLVALHDVGIDGVMLGFYDWKADFDHFLKKILPLLKEAGLRVD